MFHIIICNYLINLLLICFSQTRSRFLIRFTRSQSERPCLEGNSGALRNY